MKSKGIAVLVVGLIAVASAASGAVDEFFRDFRTQVFDDSSFERAGSGADQFVESGPDGLRIKFLDGANHEPTGVSLRFHVRGDFEITAGYAIQTLDPPTAGYGVGVGLYVETDSPTKEGITLERFVVPKAGEVFASTRASVKKGVRTYASRRFPARATRSGQLRLSRRGARVTASVAEGDETAFRKLQTVQVAPGDLFYVRLAGDTGGSTSRLDATFKDLRIKTGDLGAEPPDEPAVVAGPPPAIEVAGPPPVENPPEAPPTRPLSWVVLAAAVAAIIAVGLIAYFRRR